jgi:transposase
MQEPVIAQLMTAPGVGMVVAAAMVATLDSAGRFEHAHQVESYLGLVPREDSTGDPHQRRLGAISKQGNSSTRALLVQAAWCILRLRDPNDPLKHWGEAVAQRRGKRTDRPGRAHHRDARVRHQRLLRQRRETALEVPQDRQARRRRGEMRSLLRP